MVIENIIFSFLNQPNVVINRQNCSVFGNLNLLYLGAREEERLYVDNLTIFWMQIAKYASF